MVLEEMLARVERILQRAEDGCADTMDFGTGRMVDDLKELATDLRAAIEATAGLKPSTP